LATFFTPQIPGMIKLYKTINGTVAEKAGACHFLDSPCWDSLINRDGLHAHIIGLLEAAAPSKEAAIAAESPLAPIGGQEVWAAGVTYFSSRLARMEESKDAGGGDFYSRVYEADRPELFFKTTPARVRGPMEKVRIRKDSKWDVPEPEATLFINSSGSIQGYTIGNDMSSRSIEGENPLYLPQAKSYDGSTALGPCLLLTEKAPSPETAISLEILRGGETAFSGKSSLAMMKRNFEELVEFLYRETSFPNGAFLMTGTGIVPGNDFTLRSGDEINITIDGIGTLTNPVE
jgi:2-dehydro-3-deoxy-D-arabinonate dehydratase